MPMKAERQYRSAVLPFSVAEQSKRFETDFYVEGFAARYEPYKLYEDEGGAIYEAFERSAFAETDFSDVIFQYNHTGRVFARGSNKTLIVEPQDSGLFMAADLGLTEASRQMFEEIRTGLVTKMSWAFLPDVKSLVFDKSTRTFVHRKILKVFDVSAVSFPANADTEINARSFCNGVIAKTLEECRRRELKKRKLKLLLEVMKR